MEVTVGRRVIDKATENISRLRSYGDKAFVKARALANSIVLADRTNNELEAALPAFDNSHRAVLSARERVDSYVATGVADITLVQFY